MATIAGIPFGIQPLWVLIVALITWSLAVSWYPNEVPGISTGGAWALGFASALLLFASVLAHEYGHAIVARRRGVIVEEIDLWLLGGVAKMRGNPRKPGDELAYAAAGPAVTACVCALFALLTLVVPSGTALHALLAYEALVNALLFGFNLMPAFPLDGGRVLRALLWMLGGDSARATATAAAIGRGFGFALIAFGFLLVLGGAIGGIWLALIGVFLVAVAGAEAAQSEIVDTFSGVSASELMTEPAVAVPASARIPEVAERMLASAHPALPVTDDGRTVGMLSAESLVRLDADSRTTAGELSNRDPELLVTPDQDVARLLESAAFQRLGRAAVVDHSGRLIGVVSVTDVQRSLDLRRRLGSVAGETRQPQEAAR